MFHSLTSPFLLCAALATLARGDGSWSGTCSSVSMTLGELQANCNTPPMGPPWICSQLDLNHCYAFNSKDGIYAKDNGNFGDKCEGCEIDDDGHTMRCQCTDNKKTESYYVNTDDLVSNDQGYLRCYGHKGAKCPPDTAAVRSLTFTA
ncbi:hypothetical protein PG996_012571 [Apiospora saccharicola]|uniref:Cyanovirin-N domain-containing protein n=1 Tax=Apiospora saccharicola TaxID=335842 RepID=A0ABR1U5C7_9PEZI